MSLFSSLKKTLTASRFKRKNLNIVESIEPLVIDAILSKLINEGWEFAPQFDSQSALHSQGECIVRRGQSSLIFRLSKQSLGSIVGPDRIVKALASENSLVALSSPSERVSS